MPLPVNAHVHLNDYRAPDHHYGYSLSDYAGSRGIKHSLIKLYREPLLTGELLGALIQYRHVVDYQELSELCSEYASALEQSEVEYVSLSRPSSWSSEDELSEVLRKCRGIGVPSPSQVPPWTLEELGRISRNFIVSAHVSETKRMEETGSLHYLLNYGVRLKHVVHGVFLENWELKLLSEMDIPLVVTPRSNLWFLDRLPDVKGAMERGVTVAIGTDNAGCFHPDVWIEAHILAYSLKISPRDLLRMVLLNGYRAIGERPSYVEEGESAYFAVIDLGLANERSRFPELSIVNRVLWSPRKVIVKFNKVYVLETSRA